MGLLDDAIREHLELKRLRGADPGLVAHEEHEAFGSVRTGDAPASADDDGGALVELDEPAGEDVGWIDDDRVPAPRLNDAQADDAHTGDAMDLSSVGQETAELDMRTVLEEADHDHAPADDDGHDAAPTGRGDDALGETSVEVPHDVPGQEQLFEQRDSRDFGFDE